MMTTETFQLDLVSYEQAAALKELGFDWPVSDYFHENLEGNICNSHDDQDNYNSDDWGKDYVSQPTIALALKWLREVKGIHVYTYLNAGKDAYVVAMEHTRIVTEAHEIPVHVHSYESNSMAESVGLAYVLRHLMDLKSFEIQKEIQAQRKDMEELVLKVDNIVYFVWTDQIGEGALVGMETRSVVLRGMITYVGVDSFRAILVENNGFEKDGNEYVFPKGTLLADQDFKEFERLGKWYKDK